MVVLRLKRMGRTPPRSTESVPWIAAAHPMAAASKTSAGTTPKPKKVSNTPPRRIAAYWLSVGAQPSQTVRDLFRKMDIDPTPGRKLGLESNERRRRVGSSDSV